jgi:hypothetical protein
MESLSVNKMMDKLLLLVKPKLQEKFLVILEQS